jgi:hypothetical protein
MNMTRAVAIQDVPAAADAGLEGRRRIEHRPRPPAEKAFRV